jgi:hypothetical protein
LIGARVTQLDAVVARAREHLVIIAVRDVPDLWLWERCLRLMRLTQLLTGVPELASERPDPTAAAVAGLFHDAGWALQVRSGQTAPWQVLTRPTNDIQRELAANLLQEIIAGLLPAETLELAVETLRQCNNRLTTMPEAQVVTEAANLDEVGVLYVLRQFRQNLAEGRPLEHLLSQWARLHEYKYWEARINDCLRFEISRRLAHQRLMAVEEFMSALSREMSGVDIRRALRDAGEHVPGAT